MYIQSYYVCLYKVIQINKATLIQAWKIATITFFFEEQSAINFSFSLNMN